MEILLKRLTEIDTQEIVNLLNDPAVRKYMPLAVDTFNVESAKEWLLAKEMHWEKVQYGPYAIVVNHEFAGWGGLPPENGEPDLALVLFPKYWGCGKSLFRALMDDIKSRSSIEILTIHLPTIRTRQHGITKLGFIEEGLVSLGDKQFKKYRLKLTAT